MRGRIRKWLEIAKLVLTLGIVLMLSVLVLAGCTRTVIMRGDFCDIYDPIHDVDSEDVFANNTVYECLCLNSEAEICQEEN